MRRDRILADNISRAMFQKNIRVKELSSHTGLSDDDVLRFLEARKILSLKTIKKIAEYLDMDLYSLFNDRFHLHYLNIHSLDEFSDPNNEDKILDIMDSYCNLRDSLLMK